MAKHVHRLGKNPNANGYWVHHQVSCSAMLLKPECCRLQIYDKDPRLTVDPSSKLLYVPNPPNDHIVVVVHEHFDIFPRPCQVTPFYLPTGKDEKLAGGIPEPYCECDNQVLFPCPEGTEPDCSSGWIECKPRVKDAACCGDPSTSSKGAAIMPGLCHVTRAFVIRIPHDPNAPHPYAWRHVDGANADLAPATPHASCRVALDNSGAGFGPPITTLPGQVTLFVHQRWSDGRCGITHNHYQPEVNGLDPLPVPSDYCMCGNQAAFPCPAGTVATCDNDNCATYPIQCRGRD